jgi:hypothetical protein
VAPHPKRKDTIAVGYSKDFLSVRIGDDGTTVFVDANSIDLDTGKPGADDPADEVYVALIKVGTEGACAVSEPVDVPLGAIWTAEFPDAAGDFPAPGEVHVIGSARAGDDPPFIWHETLPISAKGIAPPPPPATAD